MSIRGHSAHRAHELPPTGAMPEEQESSLRVPVGADFVKDAFGLAHSFFSVLEAIAVRAEGGP